MALIDYPLFKEKMLALSDEHQFIGILDMNHAEPTITSIVYEVAATDAQAGKRVGAVIETADGTEMNAMMTEVFKNIKGNRGEAAALQANFALAREKNPEASFAIQKFEAAAFAAGEGVSMHFPDPRNASMDEQELEEYANYMEAAKGLNLACLDEFAGAYKDTLNSIDQAEFDSVMQVIVNASAGDSGNLDDVDKAIANTIKAAVKTNDIETLYVPYGGLHFLRKGGDIDGYIPEMATVAVAENSQNFLAMINMAEEKFGEIDLPESLYLLDSKQWIDVSKDTIAQMRAEVQAKDALEEVKDCPAIVAAHLEELDDPASLLPLDNTYGKPAPEAGTSLAR